MLHLYLFRQNLCHLKGTYLVSAVVSAPGVTEAVQMLKRRCDGNVMFNQQRCAVINLGKYDYEGHASILCFETGEDND